MNSSPDSDEAIAIFAEYAAEELLSEVPELKDAPSEERRMTIARALVLMENDSGTLKAGAKLRNALENDASFGDLRHGWIQQFGGFGSQVQSHTLHHLLINAMIEGRSANRFIAEARSFATSQMSSTESYTPLAGIKVSSVARLGPNIDLIPWSEVPECLQKSMFSSGADGVIGSASQFMPMQLRATASSAVRINLGEHRALFPSSEAARPSEVSPASKQIDEFEAVEDIVHCTTAVCPQAFAQIGNWRLFNNRIANEIIGSAFSHTPLLYDQGIRLSSGKPFHLNERNIEELWAQFLNFKNSEKKSLRVALDRINYATRRSSLVDKAIDLGIALEVMLIHGEGSHSELKYRSSIRGATFLGGTNQERMETFSSLKKAYDLRSTAVHTGILKSGKSEPPIHKRLEDTNRICARLAKKLIERGSFPDWESEYVVGGKR